MEELLHQVQTWASHGTLRQFRAEISGALSAQGYDVDVKGDVLTCYRVGKKGSFLGIGKRRQREPVLRIVRQGDETRVAEEPVDEDFVKLLAKSLEQH